MEAIRTWLNGSKDYDAGVALYNQYGDDRDMKALFKEFRTSFKEKKLVELLKGLLNKGATVKATRQQQPAKLKKETETRHGWPLKMDLPLMELYKIWQQKFKESASLQARLLDVARLGRQDKNKELEAGSMAHRILDLQDDIAGIYSDRDHYLQHDVFPGKETVFKAVSAGDAKLGERRLTVRRYLTRLKNELAKESKPHIRLKQENKWKEYSEEMKYINQKLNRPADEGIPARTK